MKATGIVRRIDDLGRIAIPKEIRRTCRLREGDPIEIFLDREGEIILKKYTIVGIMSHFANNYADVLSKATNGVIIITDMDYVISVQGGLRKELLKQPISNDLYRFIKKRESILNTSKIIKDNIQIAEKENNCEYKYQVLSPILSTGETVGCIILLSNKECGSVEEKLIETAAKILGKQCEVE